MKYRTRIYYTEADKALMWERWRQGESLNAIARLFDRNHSAVGGILSRSGGMRPRPRRRSARALALSEREEISRGAVPTSHWARNLPPSCGRRDMFRPARRSLPAGGPLRVPCSLWHNADTVGVREGSGNDEADFFQGCRDRQRRGHRGDEHRRPAGDG